MLTQGNARIRQVTDESIIHSSHSEGITYHDGFNKDIPIGTEVVADREPQFPDAIREDEFVSPLPSKLQHASESF